MSNYAFLVGVENYAPPLYGCHNDVNDMKNFLHNFCHFDVQKDIKVILDANAETIKNTLIQIVSNIRVGDRFLFYYSGHGAQLETRDARGNSMLHDALCPENASLNDSGKAVLDTDLQSIFDKLPMNNIECILIADACASANLIPDSTLSSLHKAKLLGNAGPVDILQQLKCALIAASSVTGTADIGQFAGGRTGVLTKYLLQVLQTRTGLTLPLKALVADVASYVSNHTNGSQIPVLHGPEEIKQRPFLS